MLSSSHCKKVELRADALRKMDKLKLLQLNHVKINGSYKNFPKGLRWLCMRGFHSKFIPSDLPMENLVALDMPYSNLTQLWKKPKILNLSNSNLVRVEGFSGLPALESLLVLDLSYCDKLSNVPIGISKLKNVRSLSLNGCLAASEFLMRMKDMESYAYSSSVGEFIPKTPKSILLPSLVTLSLVGSNLSNESFPKNFGSMPMLKALCLRKNPIDSLPDCVRSLSRLESESLTEIQGIIKFQAIAQIEDQILCNLGWINLQHVKDQRIRISESSLWSRAKKLPIPVQMFYEFGIFSTCSHGKAVPDWLHHKSKGSSISIAMPSSSMNKSIQGINKLCAYISRHRKAKSFKNKNMVWLSHWMFGNEIKNGDEVCVTILENKLYGGVMVRECAIGPVYTDKDNNEEDPLSYYKSWKHIIGGDLSDFQVAAGESICVLHHSHDRFTAPLLLSLSSPYMARFSDLSPENPPQPHPLVSWYIFNIWAPIDLVASVRNHHHSQIK
ncbi:unnamed protein product [Lactuca saligna]|uniref:C-JID domain-containing protein n=1 Tax=Lactuca saligna TaxID=75948 RepID=A0AA35ZU78_LACSI|nr:unnamed protein product [Lactuca saligna]